MMFSKKDLKINNREDWLYGVYYQIISKIGERKRTILPSKTSSIKDS